MSMGEGLGVYPLGVKLGVKLPGLNGLPGAYIDPHPPQSFAAAIAANVAAPIYCVVMTAARFEPVWKTDSGVAYQCPVGPSRPGVTDPANSFIEQVWGVVVNGVALTLAVSRAFVQANNGYWFCVTNEDSGTATLYISMPDGSSPMVRGNTVMVKLQYTFSQTPTDVAYISSTGVTYEAWKPWLVAVPSIGNRVAADFNAVTQIAGGSFTLQNETHFFDSRVSQNWDFGTTTLYMGFSGFGWTSFQALGTWQNSSAYLADNVFTMKTKDPKVLLDANFPPLLYTLAAYPSIDLKAIGLPVAVAYGDNFGVAPVCIDTVNRIFQVAGHQIYSINQVRVKNVTTGLFLTVTIASQNLATGQFTLGSSDWAIGQTVSVDFTGKAVVNPGNGLLYPIKNPVDVIQDLLYGIGAVTSFPDFTTVSTAVGTWSQAARAWFDFGQVNTSSYADGTLQRAVIKAPSVYINAQAGMLTFLQNILRDARAYLTVDPTGNFAVTPFRNYQASALPVVTDQNMLVPGFIKDGSGNSSFLVQAGSKPTQVQVNYAFHPQDGYNSVVVATAPRNAYTRNIPTAQQVPVIIDSQLSLTADAQSLAQSLVNEFRVDPYIYTVGLKWLAFNWIAGSQHVRLYSVSHGLDVVLEVLTVMLDLVSSKVTVTLGNLRGFEESSGFWVLSTDTTPSGATLAWPQQGQTLAPTETQYRRHQAAIWHGADDLAVDSTVGGNAWDYKDSSVSRWQ